MTVGLSAGRGSTDADPKALASFPVDPETARLLSEGLQRIQDFDLIGATKVLERAAQISPTSPRVLAALARAYGSLGEDELARSATQRAFDAAGGLPRHEQLTIESQYRRTHKDRGGPLRSTVLS